MKQIVIIISLILTISVVSADAQTTEFSYQGSLQNSGTAATGNYDFEFRLYDTVAGGTQIGPLLTRTNVAVANGTFAVKLDFGNFFNGADRFLEIRVRTAGGSGYTVLDPRQRVGSSPYAIKSLLAETANTATTATNATTAATATNATNLGGVAASQYVITTDPRMTNARAPTAGSTNYIQNQNAGAQTANLNISGNGTAGGVLSGNVVNSATQFNLNGSRFLSKPGTENTFAGIGTGTVNTGASNSFFGFNAGNTNSSGSNNAFFGSEAGTANTQGQVNTFLGSAAGKDNTLGNDNTYVGTAAGFTNTEGSQNTFVGRSAGRLNVTGNANTFTGYRAGLSTTGNSNTFIGSNAGDSAISGSNNTLIGAGTVMNISNTSFATAIGAGASVTNPNSIVLGRSADTVYISGGFHISILPSAPGTPICHTISGIIARCSTAAASTGPINAQVVEQSKELAQLRKQVETQQAAIEELKQIVCSLKPDAKGCSPK